MNGITLLEDKIFIEIVMAPAYTDKALEILEQKKNIRLLQIEAISARRESTAFDMKKVYGGLLVQQYDESLIANEDMNVLKRLLPQTANRERLTASASLPTARPLRKKWKQCFSAGRLSNIPNPTQ